MLLAVSVRTPVFKPLKLKAVLPEMVLAIALMVLVELTAKLLKPEMVRPEAPKVTCPAPALTVRLLVVLGEEILPTTFTLPPLELRVTLLVTCRSLLYLCAPAAELVPVTMLPLSRV